MQVLNHNGAAYLLSETERDHWDLAGVFAGFSSKNAPVSNKLKIQCTKKVPLTTNEFGQ
jgi:hypothetical protein